MIPTMRRLFLCESLFDMSVALGGSEELNQKAFEDAMKKLLMSLAMKRASLGEALPKRLQTIGIHHAGSWTGGGISSSLIETKAEDNDDNDDHAEEVLALTASVQKTIDPFFKRLISVKKMVLFADDEDDDEGGGLTTLMKVQAKILIHFREARTRGRAYRSTPDIRSRASCPRTSGRQSRSYSQLSISTRAGSEAWSDT